LIHIPSSLSNLSVLLSFFFQHTPPTKLYPLSLHDALPIWAMAPAVSVPLFDPPLGVPETWTLEVVVLTAVSYILGPPPGRHVRRSEEHTSELQSQSNLVCRLLLEKKKKKERTTVKSHLHMN